MHLRRASVSVLLKAALLQTLAEKVAWDMAKGNFELVTICPNFGESAVT